MGFCLSGLERKLDFWCSIKKSVVYCDGYICHELTPGSRRVYSSCIHDDLVKWTFFCSLPRLVTKWRRWSIKPSSTTGRTSICKTSLTLVRKRWGLNPSTGFICHMYYTVFIITSHHIDFHLCLHSLAAVVVLRSLTGPRTCTSTASRATPAESAAPSPSPVASCPQTRSPSSQDSANIHFYLHLFTDLSFDAKFAGGYQHHVWTWHAGVRVHWGCKVHPRQRLHRQTGGLDPQQPVPAGRRRPGTGHTTGGIWKWGITKCFHLKCLPL